MIHLETLPKESYLLRLYGEGKSFDNHDEYELSLVLVVTDRTLEIKGLDKAISREQYKQISEYIRGLFLGKRIIADRKGRLIDYGLGTTSND